MRCCSYRKVTTVHGQMIHLFCLHFIGILKRDVPIVWCFSKWEKVCSGCTTMNDLLKTNQEVFQHELRIEVSVWGLLKRL